MIASVSSRNQEAVALGRLGDFSATCRELRLEDLSGRRQGRSDKLRSRLKRTWIEGGQCVFVLWFLQVL
jgi:hypothetical protein